MAVRSILTDPDPALRVICDPVTKWNVDLELLSQDLLDTMYDAKGRGLATPQIGERLRMFVMDVRWKDGAPEPIICINPEITAVAPIQNVGSETCLSIPGKTYRVMRPIWIDLRWTSLSGIAQNWRLTGIEAICASHELDHLNGRLVIDHGMEE
jgi:peptide deformylase